MGASLGFADDLRPASGERTLATVLSEEGDKVVHRLKASRVDHGAAIATNRDKTRRA
jgi:hypothetical protein